MKAPTGPNECTYRLRTWVPKYSKLLRISHAICRSGSHTTLSTIFFDIAWWACSCRRIRQSMSFLQSLLSSADGLPSPPLQPFLLLRLPNQSPESAEVASAATSADATDALADREREGGGDGKNKGRGGLRHRWGWMDVRVELGCMDIVKAKSRSHSKLASSLADFPRGGNIHSFGPPSLIAVRRRNLQIFVQCLSLSRTTCSFRSPTRAAPARNADVSLMMSPPV